MTLPTRISAHSDLATHVGTTKQLLSELGRGEKPVAVMLTCWELGFVPDQLAKANPGEVMVVQNQGGLVSAAENGDEGGAIHSILFALSRPSVRHIIVCGHLRCRSLFEQLKTRRIKGMPSGFCQGQQHLDGEHSLESPGFNYNTVEASVLQQLENLQSHSSIMRRLNAASLDLHGWILDERSSTIATYRSSTGLFA